MPAAILVMALGIVSCTDNNDNPVDNPQPTPVDAGPSYTDKTVDVNRDGKIYGQVSLRFYSDMPSVAYISVADFHKMMTAGETMTVTRLGNLYGLATRNGTATVDVKADYLNSTTYAGFVDLMDDGPNTCSQRGVRRQRVYQVRQDGDPIDVQACQWCPSGLQQV